MTTLDRTSNGLGSHRALGVDAVGGRMLCRVEWSIARSAGRAMLGFEEDPSDHRKPPMTLELSVFASAAVHAGEVATVGPDETPVRTELLIRDSVQNSGSEQRLAICEHGALRAIETDGSRLVHLDIDGVLTATLRRSDGGLGPLYVRSALVESLGAPGGRVELLGVKVGVEATLTAERAGPGVVTTRGAGPSRSPRR